MTDPEVERLANICAQAYHDAVEAWLDAPTQDTREPSPTIFWRAVARAVIADRAAQEPPALSPADVLSGAEEMLRRIAASAGLYLDATEAGAIVAELDRLRARLDAEDAATLIAHGRQAERAAIVSWLSAQQYGLTAASVERGEHLARKEAQP